jgi:hypothetical protein
MNTISDLTSRVITPTDRVRREGQEDILSCPIPLGNKTARYATYEVEVFNFLLHHKDVLAIQSVTKFTNLLVDGQVLLSNGRRLVIEIKLRMNWLKACQSEWQFRQFLRRFNKHEKTNPVHGAIVFFEEFSGDWNKRKGKARNVWGWEAWYLFYRDAVAGKRMDLLMLCNEELRGYPS